MPTVAAHISTCWLAHAAVQQRLKTRAVETRTHASNLLQQLHICQLLLRTVGRTCSHTVRLAMYTAKATAAPQCARTLTYAAPRPAMHARSSQHPSAAQHSSLSTRSAAARTMIRQSERHTHQQQAPQRNITAAAAPAFLQHTQLPAQRTTAQSQPHKAQQ